MSLKVATRPYTVQFEASVMTCDRCGAEKASGYPLPGGRRLAPIDPNGWLYLARMTEDGTLEHDDALHFCPSCVVAAVAGARGR
jgi:hypothetical protein